MNSRFLIGQIVADGWFLVRIRGSHHHFKHPTKPGLVTVPHPKKDLLKKNGRQYFATGHALNPFSALPWRITNMLYPIAISIGDEEHAWGVEVPDLPGCFSAGEDLDDAVAMAREAIEGHFEILADDGAPIPPASKLSLHVVNPKYAGCAWAVVDIDVVKYLGKAQKLNITLPGHLLNRIDEYVLHHPEEKSRSGFLASAALKVLQQG